MPGRWRGSRRNVLHARSSTAQATNSSGSTPGSRCCADWASCAALIRRGSERRGDREISTITGAGSGKSCAAAEILRVLLYALGPIWPGRISLGGVSLGDCGRHAAIPGDGLVPFHKLSQWLTYSLVEPLEAGAWELRGSTR